MKELTQNNMNEVGGGSLLPSSGSMPMSGMPWMSQSSSLFGNGFSGGNGNSNTHHNNAHSNNTHCRNR